MSSAKYPNLAKYLERKNLWRQLSQQPEYNLDTTPLTQEDISTINDDIECDLSPENLNCDGEISRAEANAKYKLFTAAQSELEAYGRNEL